MIIDACHMSKEDTWRDFLVWFGQEVGRMPASDLEDEARYAAISRAAGKSEVGEMAAAELRRRAALEAP